jgi:hypothetical protein
MNTAARQPRIVVESSRGEGADIGMFENRLDYLTHSNFRDATALQFIQFIGRWRGLELDRTVMRGVAKKSTFLIAPDVKDATCTVKAVYDLYLRRRDATWRK